MYMQITLGWFGTNSGTVNNSTITAMILKEFNSITHENELKPDATLVQSVRPIRILRFP